MKKTIIPNDLRDFLSIISAIGFIAIFFKFALQNPFLSEIMDSVFLIIAGAGLMVIGKVFSIKKWAKDGIQGSEVNQLLSIIFGLSSMIIGFFLIFGANLPISIQGFVGFLAIPPAVFILFDYIAKNK